jgi:hypothetical protein
VPDCSQSTPTTSHTSTSGAARRSILGQFREAVLASSWGGELCHSPGRGLLASLFGCKPAKRMHCSFSSCPKLPRQCVAFAPLVGCSDLVARASAYRTNTYAFAFSGAGFESRWGRHLSLKYLESAGFRVAPIGELLTTVDCARRHPAVWLSPHAESDVEGNAYLITRV